MSSSTPSARSISQALLPLEDAPLVDTAGDYHFDRPFLTRLQHWLSPFGYDSLHLAVIQATICVQACIIVKKLGLMKLAEQERRALLNYKTIVQDMFQQRILNSNFKNFFSVMKGSQSKSDITGKQIWAKFDCAGKAICNQMMPILPDNLASIDSGKTLREAMDSCLLELYKKKKTTPTSSKGASLTVDEANLLKPDNVHVDFQFKEQPEIFFLCMKVHYFEMELTTDSAKVHSMSKGLTRSDQKRMKQDNAMESVKRKKADTMLEKKDKLIEAQALAHVKSANAIELLVANQEALGFTMKVYKTLGNTMLPNTKSTFEKALAQKALADLGMATPVTRAPAGESLYTNTTPIIILDRVFASDSQQDSSPSRE